MNSNFQNNDDNFLWKGPKSIYSFRVKNMSKADIETYLGSLPNKSNNDILGMDLVLLRKSAPYISISLANVINKSLSSGVFEQDWKNARVTPIYKDDGDINDENNYRPISVIGHIAKMIESLVSYQIIDFLEEHSFISMDQSAYLKRHSTQTSLHRVIDDWLGNVNDGAITGACLLDISKCFDSINHTILLKKLEMYGITSTELKWFSSYLSGRKQVVKCHQETSEFCDISCGVPQGSVLGPILFLLFINDISNFAVEGCVLNMYADDVIIYTSATSKDELDSRLQVCIDNISNWYSMNKLCINKKKSNVMVIGSKWQLKSLNLDDFTISVDSDKLFLASQAKYLSLWVRNDLSWDDHILELCRKMYYYFHMFRRLRKILPSALLLNIYKTYVQSKIDYGLSIWDCTTEVNLNRVQRIQSLLARIICNNFDYIHSRGIDLVRSLKLQTIRERRDYFLCVLMFKCIHGLAPHYLSNDVTLHVDIHGYDTRSAENMDLYIPRCAKEIYKRSFLYKGSSLWNKLPPWVKEPTSLNDFKHNYRLLNG